MQKSIVKIIYVFVLIVWAVEKSECKQGGHEGQQTKARDFDFYYGAACLSYGHSCWGGHGKRNAAVDMSGNPNAWFLYRMALMRKSADRDSTVDRRYRSRDRDAPPNNFNALKAYARRNPEETDGDGGEAMDASWIFRQGGKRDEPDDYRYDDDRILDDRMMDARTTEYKFVKT